VIETAPGSNTPSAQFLDASGNPLPGSGLYQAPIFEYLFPENAGVGTPVVPNNFEDFPFLVNGSGPLNGAGPIVGQLSPCARLLGACRAALVPGGWSAGCQCRTGSDGRVRPAERDADRKRQ
jgi:hypothetical protein